MSTHNISFHGEIRKLLCGYPLLSVAMKHMFSSRRMKTINTFQLKKKSILSLAMHLTTLIRNTFICLFI